jgi:hypothetical protein
MIALASCGAAAARSTAGHPICGPAAARTLAAGKLARVYSIHGSVYGCAAGASKSYTLGRAARSITAPRVGPVVVAGQVAAYGLTRFGVDTADSQVVVRRLSDGKQLASAPATATSPVEGIQSVGSIVLKTDGAVAWIGDARSLVSRLGAVVEVRRIDKRGAALLDSGTEVKPGSVRLRGSTLSWLHGGATRHASLQ